MTTWASLILYRISADLEVETDLTSYDIGQDFKNLVQFWLHIFSIKKLYTDKMMNGTWKSNCESLLVLMTIVHRKKSQKSSNDTLFHNTFYGLDAGYPKSPNVT